MHHASTIAVVCTALSVMVCIADFPKITSTVWVSGAAAAIGSAAQSARATQRTIGRRCDSVGADVVALRKLTPFMSDASYALVSGLATGIGSLPHTDAVAATRLVLAETPGLPAAPQLSRRSPLEGMLAQLASFLPGIDVALDGSLTQSAGAPATDDLAPEAWEGLFTFLDVIADAAEVPERVKVQCVGPLTLGMALQRAGLPSRDAYRMALEAVRLCVRALHEEVAALGSDVHVVCFLDEPGLVAWNDADGPIDREDAIDTLSSALAAIDGVSGVHVCGAGDRRLALDAGPNILGIEVRPDVVRDAPALARHLDNGGWIAWGAVPTDRPMGDASDPLWRTLVSSWCDCTRSGFDPALVRAQAIITPACGLANHDVAQSQLALQLAAALAARVHEQAAATRLTLGA
jgi:hypothetical protein